MHSIAFLLRRGSNGPRPLDLIRGKAPQHPLWSTGVILTVTPNLALDITYTLDEVRWQDTNRVRRAHHQCGGKGVNVARVLDTLGYPTLVTGLVGGATGQQARTELAEAGLAERLHPIAGQTRRTVVVADQAAGGATVFNEAGPYVTPAEWSGFLMAYEELLGGASGPVEAVVLAGSLPLGVRDDAYAMLGMLATARGLPVVLDTSGPALLAGVAAGPAVVKPNRDELAVTTGEADPITGAERLCSLGAQAVVCSLGEDGVLALSAAGAWRAYPPERLAGNPTGAGDAAVAGLVSGLVDGVEWPERLRRAVALSAAAVLSDVAGGFDDAAYDRFRSSVRVEEVR